MPPGTNEEIALKQRAKFSRLHATASHGFSIVEMVVSVAVLLLLAAVALPTLTRAFASYQLNDAATRLAGMLKYTRYEAIRLNKLVDCEIQQTASGWLVYADINRNQQADPGEKQDAITGVVTLLPSSGLPDPGPIIASLGNSGLTLTTISGSNAVVTFDSRGAITNAAGVDLLSFVYVLYLGNTTTGMGYRAVVLLPSGMVHVWTAPAGGVWQQVS